MAVVQLPSREAFNTPITAGFQHRIPSCCILKISRNRAAIPVHTALVHTAHLERIRSYSSPSAGELTRGQDIAHLRGKLLRNITTWSDEVDSADEHWEKA
jgi:hypothetical protein